MTRQQRGDEVAELAAGDELRAVEQAVDRVQQRFDEPELLDERERPLFCFELEATLSHLRFEARDHRVDSSRDEESPQQQGEGQPGRRTGRSRLEVTGRGVHGPNDS